MKNFLSVLFIAVLLLNTSSYVHAFENIGDSIGPNERIYKFNVRIKKWLSNGVSGFFDLSNGDRVGFAARNKSDADLIENIITSGSTIYCIKGTKLDNYTLVGAKSKNKSIGFTTDKQ